MSVRLPAELPRKETSVAYHSINGQCVTVLIRSAQHTECRAFQSVDHHTAADPSPHRSRRTSADSRTTQRYWTVSCLSVSRQQTDASLHVADTNTRCTEMHPRVTSTVLPFYVKSWTPSARTRCGCVKCNALIINSSRYAQRHHFAYCHPVEMCKISGR